MSRIGACVSASPARVRWRIALLLCGVYGLLLLPFLVWPGYLDTPLGLIAVVPMLAVFALDAMGVPGLFSDNCSWGWCDPAMAGWLVMFMAAMLMMWLVAAALLALRGSTRR